MKKHTTTILLVVIAAIVAFYGGTQYQASKATTGRNFQNGGRQGQRAGAGAQAGRPVLGEIVALDDKSVTIKLQDGSSKIVNVSGTTTISKTDAGTKTDLKTGSKIAAFGTDNSDGSITAQNIQLNPMFRMRGQTNTQQK